MDQLRRFPVCSKRFVRTATNSPSVSGPLESDTTIVLPAFIKWRPIVAVKIPAPIKLIFIVDFVFILARRMQTRW